MIIIICKKHFDFKTKSVALGGVDNYIRDLATIFAEFGYKVRIYQQSNKKESVEEGGVEIIGTGGKNNFSVLWYAEHDVGVNPQKDILIFSTDFMLCPSKFKNVIAIQHGVAWDITALKPTSDYVNIMTSFKGAFRTTKKYIKFKNCTHLVCVDYNFVNWYRTQISHIDIKLHVIPNYSKIPTAIEHKDVEKLRIIFARRLVEYRGTRIFTYAIQNVLKVHPEIEVTIAGEGPEESWMKEQLGQIKNVQFIRYSSDESLMVHQHHDIAIVPTRGSEGTSLSLLEAMAAGCAVIATNVGGMTNIILDGYNGLMISPDVKELTEALLCLIEDADLRNHIAKKGRETVIKSFSFDKWKAKWLRLIEEISHE